MSNFVMFDDENLINMVESGKSLRSIRLHLRRGPKFLLNRIKKLGLIPKDTTVQDCTSKIRYELPVKEKEEYVSQ